MVCEAVFVKITKLGKTAHQWYHEVCRMSVGKRVAMSPCLPCRRECSLALARKLGPL